MFLIALHTQPPRLCLRSWLVQVRACLSLAAKPDSHLKAASLNTGSSYLSTKGLNWSLLRRASRFGSVLQQSISTDDMVKCAAGALLLLQQSQGEHIVAGDKSKVPDRSPHLAILVKARCEGSLQGIQTCLHLQPE